MGYRYTCSDAGIHCPARMEAEHENVLRRLVEDHLRTEHPDEAVQKDKMDSLLIAGVRRV